jgi:hypothetical protein
MATLLAVTVLGGLAAVPTAAASSTSHWWWTSNIAESRLEATFHMPDKEALVLAKSDLAEAEAVGLPDAIRTAQREVGAAKRGFSVDVATCVGNGAVWNQDYYRQFRCKLEMSSDAGNDRTLFRTLHVTGKTTYVMGTR